MQLQAQTHKMRVSAIESELMKLQFSQTQEHLHYLLSIIPPSFLSFYSSPFHFIQLLKRIESKCTLIQTTLRREGGVVAGDACVNAGAPHAWMRTGYACVQRMEFTARIALFRMDRCANDAYLRAGQCVHEVVYAEHALDACISAFTQDTGAPTLALFESHCASFLHAGAVRMESALADVFQQHVIGQNEKGEKEAYHLAEVLDLQSQLMYLYHLTTHVLSTQRELDTSADYSTLQGVWAKVSKSMEMGMNNQITLARIQQICATGEKLFAKLSRDGAGIALFSCKRL